MHRATAALLLAACSMPAPVATGPAGGGTTGEPTTATPAEPGVHDGESLVVIHSGEIQAELEPCG